MQREISAAAGLHEDLCAAILVDENLPCAGLLGLRHQEVEQHGLAAARGADDQRMAEIALVEVEEIGASGIGFEQGNRIAPMIAGGTSSREGVERREGREIERGDRRGPSAPCRSEEHTSELQSLMRISYAVFSLKKKKN